MNLSGPGFTPTIPKPTQTSNKPQAGQNKPQAGQNKRRASQAPISQNVDEQPASDLPGRRRSGRIQAIKIKDDADYDHQAQGEEEDSDEEDEPAPSSSKKRKQNPSVPRTSGTYTNTKRRRQSEPQRKARSLSGTRPNPKVFGHQIGVEVGDWWDMRMSCSQVSLNVLRLQTRTTSTYIFCSFSRENSTQIYFLLLLNQGGCPCSAGVRYRG